MIGTLSTREMEYVLEHQVFGRIGCHANGLTYVVPTSYAYENEMIYCHSEEGLKVSLMRYNPEICFEVDEVTNVANWKSVICWGTFEEMTDPVQRNNALKILLKKNLPLSCKNEKLSAAWPFQSEELEDVGGVVFTIRITRKTGRFENNQFSPLFQG